MVRATLLPQQSAASEEPSHCADGRAFFFIAPVRSYVVEAWPGRAGWERKFAAACCGATVLIKEVMRHRCATLVLER